MSVEIRARALRFARAVDVVAWAFCLCPCGVEWRGLASVWVAHMSVWEGRIGDTAIAAMPAATGRPSIQEIALGMPSVCALFVPSPIASPPGITVIVATLACAARASTRIIALVVANM